MEAIKSQNGIYLLQSNYIIVRYNHECNIGLDEAVFFRNLLVEHYHSEFSIIIDRINSYSFDPSIIPALFEDLRYFKSCAWVNYRNRITISTNILTSLLPENVRTCSFSSLPSAIQWVKQVPET